jgi:hypothetical protein
MKTLASFLFLLIGGSAMAIEEPSYTIEKKFDDFEIRAYGPTLVAETKVESDFDEAGNRAFRVLADYIFGNNRGEVKIGMTAPVSQQKSQGEKIEMTAPVTQSKQGGVYVIQFMMPAKFTRQTLPEPNDPRVLIREIPARSIAVYTYSGSWSESRYKEKRALFEEALRKQGLKTKGEAIWARFNSPFSLWFLRRNEIWFEVASP